jgi:predicted GIY-YIG superfamily endonuclease
MYFVYILLCSDGEYYIGLTRNLKKRIIEHQNGLSFSTKYRRPIRLVWAGIFRRKSVAASFEHYLKTGSGKAFFKKRLI